ncbi:Hypothetical protein GLP15_2512 [Giardia lamblia P15]|uniref:Uncharacterized protein n=1 Tax=Giardia intestinalis (strain P15) TaxID=658858 RepID=E1EXA8_GIAIA|nr:Hypothetical protein GLP15_2512 [Giardia lamblia P15]
MSDLLYKDVSMAIGILLNLLRILEGGEKKLYDFCDERFDVTEFRRLTDSVLKSLAAQAGSPSPHKYSDTFYITSKTLPAAALSGIVYQHPKTAKLICKSHYKIENLDEIRLLYSFNCNMLSRNLALFLSRDFLGEIIYAYYNLSSGIPVDIDGYPTKKFFVTNGMLALVYDRIIHCMVRWTNFTHSAGTVCTVDNIPQSEHSAVYEIISQALYHLQRAHNISHYLARYPIHSSTEIIDYLKLKKEELEYYEKMHPFWADDLDSLNVGAFNMLSARVIDNPEAMQRFGKAIGRAEDMIQRRRK